MGERYRVAAAVLVGTISLAALGASLAGALSAAPGAAAAAALAPPEHHLGHAASQADRPSAPRSTISSPPALPATPVGGPLVLGDTTTPDIGSFTHLANGTWMTSHGETLTLAGYLNDFEIARFASTYGGLVVNGGGLTIYLKTLNGPAERAFQSVTPSAALTFVATPHTWEFLLALEQVVRSDWTAVTAEGVPLIGFGPSIQTGTLTLRVENPTAKDAATLEAMFGAGNVTITKGYPPTLN